MMPSTRFAPHKSSALRIARVVLTLVWVVMASGVFSGASVLADTVSVSSSGEWSDARTISGHDATCDWYGVPDNSGDDHQVRYGKPADYAWWQGCPSSDQGHRKQSGFGFQGSNVPTVTPGQPFLLGRFRHYNNPIWSPDYPLERVDLRIALPITTSGGSQSPNLDYVVGLEETPNTGQCQYGGPGSSPCPDKSWFVNTIPNQTFWIGGVEYTLEILGFQASDTYNPSAPPINEFITEENQTTAAYLFGRITALEPAIVVDKTADPTSGMAGDPITYSYAVGNAGNVALSSVSVTDDRCSPVTPVLASGYNVGDANHDNKLDTTETWQFACNYTVDANDAVGETITNTAEAEGFYQTTPVTDTDTATVTLLTDEDCDDYDITLDASLYDAGSNTTTFTYTVSVDADAVHAISHWVLGLGSCITRNDIAAASHSFEFGTDPTTGMSGIKFNVSVEKGQSKTFWIRLNGEWPVGMTDTALKAGQLICYDEVEGPVCLPSIDVEKLVSVDGGTNWVDADSATGPETPVGSPVAFKFVVTNDGKYPLSDVSLTDSDLSLAGCSIPTSLAVGASFTCTVSANAIAGQHENTATAQGSYDGETVSDTDEAHYYGQAGDLNVAKVVVWNGITPDPSQAFTITVTGPSFQSGDSKIVSAPDWAASWNDLVPGVYTVTETNPGDQWIVSGSGVTLTVPADGGAVSTTITNTRKLGGLDVEKVVDWNGVTPNTAQTFEICISGLSYPSGNCNTADYDGSILTWPNLIPGTYTVTETDPGSEWTVSGSGQTITVTGGLTATATVTNTRVQRPDLDLTKVAEPDSTSPEGVVTYTLYYTNSGNIALTNVTLVDDPDETYVDSIDNISNGGAYDGDEITWAIGDLAAGASGSVTYQATMKDDTAFDPGQTEVDNTATIDSDQTEPVEDNATVIVTLLSAPNLSLVKEIGTTGSGPWQESVTVLTGADVYYRFTVTNTGNITLTGVAIDDDTLATPGCVWPTLARGASATCVVGPVTALAGEHVNTATAKGMLEETEIESNEDSATYTGLTPAIAVVKTADPTVAYPGDTVTYSYVVTNTGAVTLTGVVLVDNKLGLITLGDTELSLNESTTGTATHVVTAGDAPEIVNTATVTGTATVGNDSRNVTDQDKASVDVILPGTITIIKDAGGDTTAEFGFTLDHAAVLAAVENGPTLPATFTLVGGGSQTFELEPGWYSIVETSLPEGWVFTGVECVVEGGNNHVGALQIDDLLNGTTQYLGEDQSVVCTFHNRYLDLALAKEVGTAAAGPWQEHVTVQVGSDVTYRLTVTNTGSLTLTDVYIDDPDVDASDCVWPDELAPGASAECIVGPVSALAGEHVNTAQAAAMYPQLEMLVESNEDSASYTGVVPGLQIAKSVSPTSADPGDTVAYTIAYSNTGTMDLTGVAITDDPDETYVASVDASASGGAYAAGKITWAIGDLAAGANGSVTYQATLKDETAFVIGQTPVDNVAVIDSDQTGPAEDTATVTVTRLLQPAPGLTIDKVGSVTTAHIGDTVAYTITVRNTGNITLTNVTVVDAKLGIDKNLRDLAPGASAQVAGSYEVTEADLEGVVNTAVADSDQTEPVDDTWTVTVVSGPALSIEKVGSTATAHIGDTVAYTITVRNTGDVTLTNVTVVDAKLGIDEAIGDLEVGASKQVTGSYLVTEADLGGIVNKAIADSTETDPPVEDSWTVEVISGPALSIDKVGSTAAAKLGDTVLYTITVRNIGDVTLTNVAVVDAKLGINQNVGSLAPGASAQVTGSYLVTVADLGGVVNTAVADADQTEPVQDTWTVEVGMQPGLVIVKTVNTATAAVGDLITYTLTVTNTGDVPLTDVTISDPLLGIVHNIGPLAVGESARMEVPYTVTEDDIEGIHNLATVTGKDPEGRTLTDDDEATVVVRPIELAPTPEPCIRSDVAVVIYGGWNDIPVKAWVGGTEQDTLYTAVDAFGQQQVMWSFYPPENASWTVSVQPQTPEGKDPARWQYKLVRIESPSLGTENNSPGSPSVSITRCNQYVLYFQLMDNGTTPPVAPTPPSEPRLPVTGGGPEPIVAGGLGLFAALSGLGWSIRRRR